MSEVVDDPPELYQTLQSCLEVEFSMDSEGGMIRRVAKLVKFLSTLTVDKSRVILKRLP